MNAMKTWLTKEEVLRDLAEATGTRVGELSEEYLVVGERPPPKHVIEEDDDDMNLLFGRQVNRSHVHGDSSPDLDGITEMLRMVNDYDNEDEGHDNGLLNPADTIITISKVTTLNPNVKEFVPKHAVDSNSSSDNLDHLNNDKENVKTENESGCHIQQNVEVTQTKVKTEKSDDIKLMTAKLKKQINDSSDSDSFENKRQKNVAIATLLKLYAKAPTGTQDKASESKQAVKLMTPEDFTVVHNGRVHEAPEVQNSLPQDGSSENTSKCSLGSGSTPVPNPVLSPEEKASIDKVNEWLEEPAKKKIPTFSNPIGFKRKETKTPKSPVSNYQKSVKPVQTEQYKPSKYASDLSKQYLERKKVEKAKRNMWADLDIILKEKDEAMKSRLEQQSLNNHEPNTQ